jgi:hypothetical protein
MMNFNDLTIGDRPEVLALTPASHLHVNYRVVMENPHAERQAVLLERILKNTVRKYVLQCALLRLLSV